MNTLMVRPEMESGSAPALLGTRYWPQDVVMRMRASIPVSARRFVGVLEDGDVVFLERDETRGDYHLYRYSACGEFIGRLRYGSIDEVQLRVSWDEVEDSIQDGHAYAVQCARSRDR